MKLIISDQPVSFGYVRTPKESPVGILDNATLEVTAQFDPDPSRKFHVLERDGQMLTAIDIETGEIVTLDFSRAFPDPPCDDKR